VSRCLAMILIELRVPVAKLAGVVLEVFGAASLLSVLEVLGFLLLSVPLLLFAG